MRAAAAGALLVSALVFAPLASAHKGITSKFTYNAHVYPIFLNRCGRCHIDGGVGPMSLLKYEDAFPWAESVRSELLSAYPDSSSEARSAQVDSHDFVKAAHRQISARELDVVLEWANGGTPEGDAASRPVPPPLTNTWTAGDPTVVVQMSRPYDMPASAIDATQEFTLPVPSASPLTVARFDGLPGNAAIVRSAVLSLRASDGTTQLLGTWFPRQAPAPISLKPAVRIDPGSQLLMRIQYKKTWKMEGQATSDRTAVGLYSGE